MRRERSLLGALALGCLMCLFVLGGVVAPMAKARALTAEQQLVKTCDTGYAAYKAANPLPDGTSAKAAYDAYLSACLKPPAPAPAPTPAPSRTR